ncbi:MAG: SRPBCC family protein [Longimicrobiales bacterium]|jgi:ligand-binding SRPBCC domain-containing protein
MRHHRLERAQVVAGELADVFAFFRDPSNLEAITPPWLRFEVRSSTSVRVRQGTTITYGLRWQIFPLTWKSRIAEYEEGRLFADEMLSGPYERWYHRHLFSEVSGGVKVTDIVEYRLPFGPLGRLVHFATVRGQLEAIFDYRRDAIARLFAPLDS